MKNYKLIEIGSLLVMAVLLAYDFFPALNNVFYIPKAVLFLLFASMVLSSFLMKRGQIESEKDKLITQIVLMVYVLGLIIVFTAFGGSSQVGVSLESPVLWIIFAISLIQIQRQWKKAAKQDS